MKLFVSYNCGISYHEEKVDEGALKKRCAELNAKHLRYYVEHDDGRLADVCGIHKNILAFMGAVRGSK